MLGFNAINIDVRRVNSANYPDSPSIYIGNDYYICQIIQTVSSVGKKLINSFFFFFHECIHLCEYIAEYIFFKKYL